MPKGIYTRPEPRGITQKSLAAPLVPIPKPLEEACANFEKSAGGRQQLIEHLAHAPLNQEQQLLIGAIADPRNDDKNLARICYTYGIHFSDLLTVFRQAGMAKAAVKAMQRVWDRLPDVAGDVMERSLPHEVTCFACGGKGETTKAKVRKGPLAVGQERRTVITLSCGPCAGSGKITKQPKLETQKVALELGGLLQPKGAQVEVNVQQNQGIVASPSAPVHFYQDSDRALYPDAIDAEAAPIRPAEAEQESFETFAGEFDTFEPEP